jgi:hypothetical protein
MALTEADAREVVKGMVNMRQAVSNRLDKIRGYLAGESRAIYMPRDASREYKMIVDMSKVNLLPLVVDSYVENLFVEGYRRDVADMDDADELPDDVDENAWRIWQANRMDVRQSGIYASALRYGTSYATALPGRRRGEPMPVITPYAACDLTAAYEDPVNDEWPVYGLSVGAGFDRVTRKSVKRVTLYDEANLYHFTTVGELNDAKALQFVRADAHGMSVTPIVRWQSDYGDLDGGPCGIVEPLIELQDQVDNTTFGLLIAQQYAAFKQRWAIGMAIEEDEKGAPKQPFNPGVNRLWQNESPDGRFGEFQETNLAGYLDSRQSALRLMSSKAQLPAHALLVSDGITNLSAEALAALEAPFQRQVQEFKTSFGESDEQLLRLCALAAGDRDGWSDESAQVVWRDTESRSLAQIADAWGKLVTMLNIPPQAAWERIPNVTQQDVRRWREMSDEQAERDAEQLAAMGAVEDGIPSRQPAVPVA